jgi:hypothetical protein
MITTSNAMLSPTFRALIIGGLIALLAGCSALRLGYGQGPTLGYWWMDRYVDFDAAQSDRVRKGLDEWFRWHRTQRLGELTNQLARAQRELQGPMTAAQACAWTELISSRVSEGIDQALPTLAEVALTLQPAQLQKMERRYARSNAELSEELLTGTPAERLEAAVKRATERAEFFYGRLDEAQRVVVVQGVAASPFDAAVWMAERKARQQDILSSLRRWRGEGASMVQVQQGIKDLLQQNQRSSREAYRSYQKRLLAYNCAFAANVHNATTPSQRAHAQRKLKGWEDDLRNIAGDAPG